MPLSTKDPPQDPAIGCNGLGFTHGYIVPIDSCFSPDAIFWNGIWHSLYSEQGYLAALSQKEIGLTDNDEVDPLVERR